MNEPLQPWKTEPDYEYFTHRGVACLVARMPDAGHVNGYIALPDTHAWFGRDVAAFRELTLNFLHPITFAQEMEAEGLKVYVIGFDTAHGYCPHSPGEYQKPEHYSTFDEVINYTKELATEARSGGKVKFIRTKKIWMTQAWNYPWNLFS